MGPRWVLSAHAATVVRERGIRIEWIARALASPGRIEVNRTDPMLRQASATIEEREGRVMRVVYRASCDPWLVVTAFSDRAETRKLSR
jgi:hypothetical protein